MQCNAGQYSAQEGASACTACGAGKYGENLGSDHANGCIECVAGKYVDVAGSDDSTDCISCPIARYSSGTGRRAATDCLICTAGSITDSLDAPGGSSCIACPAGKFSATELTVFNNALQCNVDHTIGSDILNTIITEIRVVRVDGEQASWTVPPETLNDIFHQEWHGIAGETDDYKVSICTVLAGSSVK